MHPLRKDVKIKNE